MLRADGMTVFPLDDPGAAIETIRRTHPDLVITDMRMPGVTGHQLLVAIRELWPALPVMVLTGVAEPTLKKACLEAGAVAVLHKTVRPSELITAIRKHQDPSFGNHPARNQTRSFRRHSRVAVNPSIVRHPQLKGADLSASGMRLESPVEYLPGAHVEFDLVLEGIEVNLYATVRWCNKRSSIFKTGYYLGVKFAPELPIATILAIRRFLELDR